MTRGSGAAWNGEGNPVWAGGKTKHPLNVVYKSMIARCETPTHKWFGEYGGRGIAVCAAWREDFWAFVRDVGPRPEGTGPSGMSLYSLDRIDNDGDYEPGNVRWALTATQIQNSRSAKLTAEQVVAIRADTRLHREIAATYGVDVSTISNIKSGATWRNI